MLHLIPMPKKIGLTAGSLPLASLENLRLPQDCPAGLLEELLVLADELEATTRRRLRFAYSEIAGTTLTLTVDAAIANAEGYTLKIDVRGIALAASTEAGLFYGIQTLRQLIRTEGTSLPCLEIEDAPDFPARGFYHDCTRGKIPTLETLFHLVDKLAYYKLNQLQLYIEHTFAFARHSDMWSGADPLTAEDILRLDAYCRKRHVELVPSLSTFGHFYMGLRNPRQADLNELDDNAPSLPFSYFNRMLHYTLNPSDPRSLHLVDDMLKEFLPLFSSKYFNICCDETFDLGKGKNAQLVSQPGNSIEKLYTEFLLKIIRLVNKMGRTVMFWGDIIAAAPDLLKDLPKDTIPLEWDYSATVEWRNTQVMKDSGLNFYLCPGVSGWHQFLNDINNASLNITKYVKRGLDYGASGILNTDWGDYGHANALGCSYHGLALGAGCSWNWAGNSELAAFDEAFSWLELGDRSGSIVAAWRNALAKQCFTYGSMSQLFDPGVPEKYEEFMEEHRKKTPAEVAEAIAATEDAEAAMANAAQTARPLDPLALEEILCCMHGNMLMQKLLAVLLDYEGAAPWALADELRAFEMRFSALWHRRNRPSEYYRIRELFMRATQALDAMGASARQK